MQRCNLEFGDCGGKLVVSCYLLKFVIKNIQLKAIHLAQRRFRLSPSVYVPIEKQVRQHYYSKPQ